MIGLLQRLLPFISYRRKLQLCLIFFLMFLSAFAEIISIGAVVPFLGVLLDPTIILDNHYFIYINHKFQFDESKLILITTILFIIVVILSALIKFSLLWNIKRVGHGIGSDLSILIYDKTINQPYQDFIKLNSSDLISGISTKISVVTGNVLLPILQFFSSSLIISIILLMLVIVNPIISLVIFFILGSIYSVILLFTKSRLKKNSQRISHSSNNLIKVIQESVGGIRDIILGNYQDYFNGLYLNADQSLRKGKAENEIISAMPKFLMETVGIIIISIIAFIYSSDNDNLLSIIPLLGATAVGAQKILPLLQQVYASISMIRGETVSFHDVLGLLHANTCDVVTNKSIERISFDSTIEFRDVSFSYSNNNEYELSNVNLRINKGDIVGIIGETGSGKSTFIDLLIGLLRKNKGEILIDGRSLSDTNINEWRSLIAHVPQSIYLTDNTIKENIAFGVSYDEINFSRVEYVCEKACLNEFVDKLDTIVGERGINLSGGQRQRIGIARALYDDSKEIIVFDEATSALDDEIESKIIESLHLNLKNEYTIFMIAHRLSSLKHCNKIITISNGEIKSIKNGIETRS